MIILVFFFSFAPSPSTTCGGRLLKVSTFPLDSIFRVSSALRYTNPSTHRHMTYRASLFSRFPRLPLYIISCSYHARISTFNLHNLYTASPTLPSLKLVRAPSHLNLFSGIFYPLSFLFHFRQNNIINTLRTIIRYG